MNEELRKQVELRLDAYKILKNGYLTEDFKKCGIAFIAESMVSYYNAKIEELKWFLEQ